VTWTRRRRRGRCEAPISVSFGLNKLLAPAQLFPLPPTDLFSSSPSTIFIRLPNFDAAMAVALAGLNLAQCIRGRERWWRRNFIAAFSHCRSQRTRVGRGRQLLARDGDLVARAQRQQVDARVHPVQRHKRPAARHRVHVRGAAQSARRGDKTVGGTATRLQACMRRLQRQPSPVGHAHTPAHTPQRRTQPEQLRLATDATAAAELRASHTCCAHASAYARRVARLSGGLEAGAAVRRNTDRQEGCGIILRSAHHQSKEATAFVTAALDARAMLAHTHARSRLPRACLTGLTPTCPWLLAHTHARCGKAECHHSHRTRTTCPTGAGANGRTLLMRAWTASTSHRGKSSSSF
jgi:hypothetical protein